MSPSQPDVYKEPSRQEKIASKSDYMAGEALDFHPDVVALKKVLKKRFAKLLKSGMPKMEERDA